MVRESLEKRAEERKYCYDLSEVIRHPKVSTRLRTAEAFGFESDNYYTAEEKMIMESKKGGLVAGPFSKHLPAS